jgi:hypothetical protein
MEKKELVVNHRQHMGSGDASNSSSSKMFAHLWLSKVGTVSAGPIGRRRWQWMDGIV